MSLSIFPLFSLCYEQLPFFLVKKNLWRLPMHYIFWGVEDMWGGSSESEPVCWLCSTAWPQDYVGTTKIRCTRVQGAKWVAEREERELDFLSVTLLGKPVCCEIVEWVWVSLWTGLNPSDLTLIKFKICHQQSGNFCSIVQQFGRGKIL